jgi:hypothetical protein
MPNMIAYKMTLGCPVMASRMISPVPLPNSTQCHSQSFAPALETLKMTERRGNVIENKGSVWKRWQGSWNVIENKGV